MNQLNKQIADIFKEHENRPALMIQQLFNLMGSRPPEQSKVIQLAILYSMESIHEWNNLYYYIHKWNTLDFRHNLIQRMRKRLEETNIPSHSLDQSAQLKRLIDKYLEAGSPKRNENNYQESVNNQFRREQNTIKNKEQTQNSKQSENQRYNRIEKPSNEVEQATSGGQKQLKLQNLTGRPPILKKSSLASDKMKKQASVSLEEPSNNKVQQAGSKANIVNLTQLRERLSLKMSKKSQQNLQKNEANRASNNKPITNDNNYKNPTQQPPQAQRALPNRSESSQLQKQTEKYNQSFPPIQQFSFGSSKKQKEPEPVSLEVKAVTKLPLEKKVRKIRKNSNEDNTTKDVMNKSEQFSFMDDAYDEDASVLQFSEIKKEQFTKQFVTSSKKRPFFGRNTSLSMQAFDTQKSNQKDVYENLGKLEQETPYFPDQKAHSNQFLTKQEMSVVQQVQCLYLFNNLLKEKRIDVQSLFQSALAQRTNRK